MNIVEKAVDPVSHALGAVTVDEAWNALCTCDAQESDIAECANVVPDQVYVSVGEDCPKTAGEVKGVDNAVPEQEEAGATSLEFLHAVRHLIENYEVKKHVRLRIENPPRIVQD